MLERDDFAFRNSLPKAELSTLCPSLSQAAAAFTFHSRSSVSEPFPIRVPSQPRRLSELQSLPSPNTAHSSYTRTKTPRRPVVDTNHTYASSRAKHKLRRLDARLRRTANGRAAVARVDARRLRDWLLAPAADVIVARRELIIVLL